MSAARATAFVVSQAAPKVRADRRRNSLLSIDDLLIDRIRPWVRQGVGQLAAAPGLVDGEWSGDARSLAGLGVRPNDGLIGGGRYVPVGRQLEALWL